MSKANRKRADSEFQSAHVILAPAEIDNPDFSRDHAEGRYGNHKRMPATINVRESAIVTMQARKLLTDAQAEAATRFRGLWETMGGKGAGAMDYSKEPVDGGGAVQTVADHHIDAGRKLREAEICLGRRGYSLVSKVCGEGYQISELFHEKRAQLSAMDLLRGLLDDLAELWLLKSRTTNMKRCA